MLEDIISAIPAAIAAAGIWRGIFVMDRSNKDRAEATAEAAAQRREAAKADARRHAEAMRALEALITRTGATAPKPTHTAPAE